MAVMRVSSSEFRVKMKDLANQIAEEQHRVIVTRHGGPMMVVIGEEDYQFLRKHKPGPTPRVVPDPEPDPFEGIDHPDRMETADIERIYPLTEGIENEWIESWRIKARISLRLRNRSLPGQGAGAHPEGGRNPVPVGGEAVVAPIGDPPQARQT